MALRALEPIEFPWFDYSRYTFSLGLDLGGGAAILSGHTASAYDPAAGKITVKGGLADQVRTAYAKIEAILAAGGSSLEHVTRVVEYIRADILDEYPEIERVRNELLGGARPVVNTVSVRSLLRRDALLEVEVTARRREADDPLDGIVYLPSLVGSGVRLDEQTAAALQTAIAQLEALALGANSIAKITQYIRIDALGDLAASDAARRRSLAGARTALTRVPVERLRDPSSLVQFDVMASRHPAAPIDPGWAAYEELGAVPALRAGRVVFLSGQGGRDPQSGLLGRPHDVAGQAEDAYRSLKTLLEAAGGGAACLVKTVEYTSPDGLAAYRSVADVRSRHLFEPYPASTGLVEPSLLMSGQQIEVDALAVLPA